MQRERESGKEGKTNIFERIDLIFNIDNEIFVVFQVGQLFIRQHGIETLSVFNYYWLQGQTKMQQIMRVGVILRER